MKLNPHLPDNDKPSSWVSWHWYFPMVNTGNLVANCVLNFVAYVAALAVISCGYRLYKGRSRKYYHAASELRSFKRRINLFKYAELGYRICEFYEYPAGMSSLAGLSRNEYFVDEEKPVRPLKGIICNVYYKNLIKRIKFIYIPEPDL
jgi:hypothetical protein